MYGCMCVYTYVCMYVCMYVCVHAMTSSHSIFISSFTPYNSCSFLSTYLLFFPLFSIIYSYKEICTNHSSNIV